MKFNHLLSTIQQTHDALQAQAVAAINRSLTIRNWLIGFYIVEFEQKGEDRARYGDALLESLSSGLKKKGLTNIHERDLRRFRVFYSVILIYFKLLTYKLFLIQFGGHCHPFSRTQFLEYCPRVIEI